MIMKYPDYAACYEPVLYLRSEYKEERNHEPHVKERELGMQTISPFVIKTGAWPNHQNDRPEQSKPIVGRSPEEAGHINAKPLSARTAEQAHARLEAAYCYLPEDSLLDLLGQETIPLDDARIKTKFCKLEPLLRGVEFERQTGCGYELQRVIILIIQGKFSYPENAPDSYRDYLKYQFQWLFEELCNNAGLHKNNLKAIEHLIQEGCFCKEKFPNDSDELPGVILPLRFPVLSQLLNNNPSVTPSSSVIKAMLASEDARVAKRLPDVLSKLSEVKLLSLLVPALRTAGIAVLEAVFRHLWGRMPIEMPIYKNISRTGIFKSTFYTIPTGIVFTLELMAKSSPARARFYLRWFSPEEQRTIARVCLSSGLHRCFHLLTEIEKTCRGTDICFVPESISDDSRDTVVHSFVKSGINAAKALGLTSDNAFVSLWNRVDPDIWLRKNSSGKTPLQHLFEYARVMLGHSQRRLFDAILQQTVQRQGEVPEQAVKWIKMPYCDYRGAYLRCRLHFLGLNTYPTESELAELKSRYPDSAEIIQKIKDHNGFSTIHDFVGFMDWLMVEKHQEACRKVRESLPSKQHPFRPDIYPDPNLPVSEPSSSNQVDMDEPKFSDHFEPLTDLYDMLEAFLMAAPESHRIAAIKHWLNDPECEAQRKTLFSTPYYPLNTGQRDVFFWNLLLTVDQDCPEPDNPLNNEWQSLISGKEAISCTAAPDTLDPLFDSQSAVAGRTLRRQKHDGGWDYLKFLSNTETLDKLKMEGGKIQLLKQHKDLFGLKSDIPCVEGLYLIPQLEKHLNNLRPEEKSKLLEKVNVSHDGPGYALHLTTPPGQDYHLYSYDLDPDTMADDIKALFNRSAHDLGQLWSRGLLGPQVMASFHDEASYRMHLVLAPYAGYLSEGDLCKWSGSATDHPNIGPVGVRDFGDTKSPMEFNENYFYSHNKNVMADFDKRQDRNRVRLSELANFVQGLVLEYARCFKHQFDYRDIQSVTSHESAIKAILKTSFLRAFPKLSEQAVELAMEQNGLLRQTVTQTLYWCAADVPYVQDLRNGRIPAEVYPDWPANSMLAPLGLINQARLTDRGFTPGDSSSAPHLGGRNGRMVLMSLNTLICKLLAVGVCAMIDTPSQESNPE